MFHKWNIKRFFRVRRLNTEGWITIDELGGKTIFDIDVYRFAMKHMRWYDKLNPKQIAMNVLQSQCILMGALKPPEGDWKFPI